MKQLHNRTGAGRLVIAPETATVGQIVRNISDAIESRDCVLLAPRLDFSLVNEILNTDSVSVVLLESDDYSDHARKMLQEAGVALVLQDVSDIMENKNVDRCIVDADGVTLFSAGVPISAICSVINDRNLRNYQRFGISSLGYFRFKFCLFQLFSERPDAFKDETVIEEFLLQRLRKLGKQHWTSIRCVLSDPTTAELAESGVDVAVEVNPDLGVRGPRIMERWIPELRAVRQFMEESDVIMQICAPFISSIAEYQKFVKLVEEVGIDMKRIRLGFTLEVPAMVELLDELFTTCRVDFMGIGTTDLFSLYNAIDRNNPQLNLDPSQPENIELVRHIVQKVHPYNAQIFVCGDVRRNHEMMRELIGSGVNELICSPTIDALTSVTRLSAA